MRRRLEQQGFGADHGFHWRGGDISRLEGLSDAVFAFAVCFAILFWVLFDQLLGDAPAGAIEQRQVPLMMLVYGAGFIAVQLVFSLLYLRAHRLADTLELTTYERLTTRSEIQGFAINVAIGLTSIAIVAVGGPDAAFWSGMVYVLIMPLQVVNGRVMGGRIRQAFATSPRA
ncbi:MAG TPA: hypothetical protein VJ735_20335 [Actinomycetes bacterium]|nr:hypothetical protein [Actinomycetes bacterium]